VCPVEATYIDDEGLVGQIYPRCIGCRYCANACPYTVKYFNWYGPEWSDSERRHLNPDVSVRPKGVIEKCTFCHHRLQKAKEDARAEERELREQDYQPACAEVCPTSAIIFGDLENPNHRVAELKEDPRAMRLMEELGTQPKVHYLRTRE
jgi:molybdopterin-containing oxidoreductase family iron-sulfur binding subunit